MDFNTIMLNFAKNLIGKGNWMEPILNLNIFYNSHVFFYIKKACIRDNNLYMDKIQSIFKHTLYSYYIIIDKNIKNK